VKAKESFFDLCYRYKRIPSGMARFCTSELKTRPCEEFIRNYCKQHGFTKVISALGIRAEESPSRAKKGEWVKKTKLITIWNPILHFSIGDVLAEITLAKQTIHWVYSKGYSRLSCVLCPFGRIGEHKQMAKDRPELYQKMAKLERDLGKTIRLKQINGVKYPKYLGEYIN
jgi:3'-phosphoadenosine 5'-phosphosulfate sulfotransferase (PAPS reductase)/FAD synthetase